MANQIYLERTERKFEVGIGKESLPSLCADVSRYIPLHEFVPGQQITHNNTIYFDSEDCLLLRSGLLNKLDHIRIRARKYEYESLDPQLYYWLEFRIRKGDVRRKQRLKLEGKHLRRLLAGEKIDPKVLEYNRPHADPKACRALYGEIQNTIVGNGLRPVLWVAYQRAAFENGLERVTVDWDIRYYHVGPPVFRYKSLKNLKKKPAGREKTMVLELKYSGDLPSWMSDLQQKYPIRCSDLFSKLVMGMKALLEGPLKSRAGSGSLLRLISACLQDEDAVCGRP